MASDAELICCILSDNGGATLLGESGVGVVVVVDGSGGFWELVVDVTGNIGTESVAGPATSDVILSDGFGGFWQIVVDVAGNRGTTSVAGPATAPVPVLVDSNLVTWTLIVDSAGNLGATS